MTSKIPYDQRFGNFANEPAPHSAQYAGPGLCWIIVSGPRIIDTFSYEAGDFNAARSSQGQVKKFYTVKAARRWAERHPERLP